jgi:putative hydrolase of HD superfamily
MSATMPDDRLARQVAFLIEADKLKTIIRRTPLVDSSRRENSAEHSWHLILAAIVMREYICVELNLLHALEMMTVHDLVEIDAGDTFAYDMAGQATRSERELFEGQETPESRFANAVDRFQPLLQNAGSGGGSWSTHQLTREQVLQRMGPIESALPRLWPLVVEIIDSFCAPGLIRRDP